MQAQEEADTCHGPSSAVAFRAIGAIREFWPEAFQHVEVWAMRGAIAMFAIWLVYVLGSVSARADMVDPPKAARGMGYANYVYEKSKCDGAIKNEAVTLQNDISNLYRFSYDDLLGKTAIGASVNKGRASARNDEMHPEYKGQFCDSMDEVLGVWRSEVMPSPK